MKALLPLFRYENNGDQLMCSLCNEPVLGAKFQCVNCPYLICCVQCELSAVNHRNAPTHALNHVFEITLP